MTVSGNHQYTEEFKKAAVQKFLSRGTRSVESISEEIGTSQTNLYKWTRIFGSDQGMKKSNKGPNKRSQIDKFKFVVEYEGLASEMRGAYLRKHGLYEENIASWRAQMLEALDEKTLKDTAKKEANSERKKVKILEAELRRKNSALAETTALLILKKKANLIWGQEDDE